MTSSEKKWIACMAACLAIVAVLSFGALLGVDNTVNSIVSILALVVFTLLHGRVAMGWPNLAVFAAITAAVSFTSEAIGVATGWIYGSYYYTDHLGPKILGVPPFIQLAYISMSYASLVISRIILGALRTPKNWGGVGVAVSGAILMVGWDVAMDPYQSTIAGDWIWRDGGPYFGVPMRNYAGWFGTVFVFMLLYMIYERAHRLPALSGFAANRWFWSLPVINYALIALGVILVPIVGLPAPPQNYTGSLPAFEYSLTLIALFSMGTPAVLAFVRLMLDGPDVR